MFVNGNVECIGKTTGALSPNLRLLLTPVWPRLVLACTCGTKSGRRCAMRKIAAATLACAMAAMPQLAPADELSDLKAQLDAAQKAIQALQHRVESLEAEKTKQQAAAPAPAQLPAA